jgi:RHS repeat-associated protein
LVAILEENATGGIARTLLPVSDGLGSVTVVIDQATGQPVARFDFGPFGEPLGESGETWVCPFRWQTKWYDAESQQYYFGYRYYDPRLGRWLSRDPIRESGGFNLYAYCGNDPVNRHDPLGLDWNPFHKAFWVEGFDANVDRAGSAMLRFISWLASPPEPPVLLEVSQNSHTQNSRNLIAGIQEGTGRAILAGPSAFFSLQSGLDTFVNRAIGSSYGIPDHVLESTDLRDPSTIAFEGSMNLLQQGNTAFAESMGANPSSQLFQASSQATTLAALTLAPELGELELPEISLSPGTLRGFERLNPSNYDWAPFFAPYRGGYLYSGLPLPGSPKYRGPTWTLYRRHGGVPSPRPKGYQSHHGVNSVWLENNVLGYNAEDAPAVLVLNDPFHNRTRGVFNRVRNEIAARQGVSPRDIDWKRIPPGTAWRLAEEQLEAAQVPLDLRQRYFDWFNEYLESLH